VALHRLYVVLHGTPGSYLRNALHADGAVVVAYLLAPRAYAYVFVVFSSSLPVHSTTFFVEF
jgi:hypothetical protein